MRTFTFVFGMLFISAVLAQQGGKTGTLIVKYVKLRSDEGLVRSSLFKSAEGFPSKREKAAASAKADIKNRQAELIFRDVKYGTYAVGMIHDENSNDKFDTNIFRIPKEGFGASNDARGSFGPPSFDDAKFELKSDTLQITITVAY